MNRIIAVVLAVLLLIALAGCVDQANNNTSITTLVPPTNHSTNNPTPNPTTHSTSEPVYKHPTLSTSPDYPTGYTPADIPRVYWNAINNKQPIYFPEGCPDCIVNQPCENTIDFYKFPYEYNAIATSNTVKYAVVDMDGDGMEELLIKDNDTLLLRQKDGIIYGYSFIFRHMDHVYTDGNFSWNGSAGLEYGRSKIIFNENNTYRENELYKINVIDAETYKISINGNEATQEQLEQINAFVSQTEVEWKRLERFPIREYSAKD